MVVDLNRASLEQLMQLGGLDKAKAYDVLLWRPYKSWDEVEDAAGLTPHEVERLRAAGLVVDAPRASAWPTFAVELARGRRD